MVKPYALNLKNNLQQFQTILEISSLAEWKYILVLTHMLNLHVHKRLKRALLHVTKIIDNVIGINYYKSHIA